MNKSSAIKLFFESLAIRMCKENDLSDIIWAMCKASSSFQKLFLNFFFGKVIDDKTIESIDREVSDDNDGSFRVDFLIRVRGEETYIIENKIYDQNHHFEDYVKAYGVEKENFGYITNYSFKKEGYSVKHWSDFYSKLCSHIEEENSEEEKKLMIGFKNYLQSVCNIIKIEKKMELKSVYSMFELFAIIAQCINQENENYCICEYNRGSRNIWNGCYSQNFELEYKKICRLQGKQIWGYVCFRYDLENPLLYVCFENAEGWGKPLYDYLKEYLKENNKPEGEYIKAVQFEDDWICKFELKDDIWNDFDNKDLSEQKDLIRKLIEETLSYPLRIEDGSCS